ncbi:MAG TPA: DUF6113 family protein [Mycobacteriales bacterium]|nr:DUF6113 family protein [Mycobacteriales bacterium]
MTAGVARDPAADAARTGPGQPGPGDQGGQAESPRAWQRVLAGVLVGLGAVELGVLECFLVPFRIGGTSVPVALLLALVGNVVLTRAMYRATAHRAATAVPVVAWLALVLVLASKTAEGDLVVPGTWPGLLFLFGGTIAGAVAVGRTVAPSRRR